MILWAVRIPLRGSTGFLGDSRGILRSGQIVVLYVAPKNHTYRPQLHHLSAIIETYHPVMRRARVERRFSAASTALLS